MFNTDGCFDLTEDGGVVVLNDNDIDDDVVDEAKVLGDSTCL